MPFGIPIKDIVLGIAAAAVALVITLGYTHYVSLENQVTTLHAQMAQKDDALAVQKDTITQQKDAIVAWKGAMNEFKKDLADFASLQADLKAQKDALDAKFARHDLSKDASAAPLAVERVINAGSARAAADLMCASGAHRPDCSGSGGPPAAPAGSPTASTHQPSASPLAGPYPNSPPSGQ